MKKSFAVLAGLLLATAASPAFAQDAEEESGPITISGGVAVTTDYRFRGVSLSDEDIAVQPTLTVSHESGFYVGAWGSNLDDTPLFGEVEIDLYGGYNTDIAEGTNLDVGLTYYWYPDGDNAAGPSDYWETIVKLSHDIGPVTATGTVGYSWEQSSLGDEDNLYLGFGLSTSIPDTPVTLVGSVGYTDGALGALASGGNYLDWSLGADFAVGPTTLGIRYIDTDVEESGIPEIDTLSDASLVLTFGISF
ncbi:MAG: porin [Sphingopyxis sp.]|nr:porin [Sphingopyxis sp.]